MIFKSLCFLLHPNALNVRCSKKHKDLRTIVERPRNPSFGQVEQDETKNFKIGAYLVYRNRKNIPQRILPKNTKEMSVFQFFTFNSKFCSCEMISHYLDQFVISFVFRGKTL